MQDVRCGPQVLRSRQRLGRLIHWRLAVFRGKWIPKLGGFRVPQTRVFWVRTCQSGNFICFIFHSYIRDFSNHVSGNSIYFLHVVPKLKLLLEDSHESSEDATDSQVATLKQQQIVFSYKRFIADDRTQRRNQKDFNCMKPTVFMEEIRPTENQLREW